MTTYSVEQISEHNQFRAAFRKEYSRDTVLSDEQIRNAIEDNATEEDVLDDMLTLDNDLSKESGSDDDAEFTVDASKMDENAVKIGDILAKSAALDADVQEFVVSREKLKKIPASVARVILKIVDKQTLASMPEPSSRYDDEAMGPGNIKSTRQKLGLLYDVRKAGEGSFFGDMWSRLPMAAQVQKELQHIASAEKNEAGTPQYLLDMDASELKEEKGRVKARRTNGIAVLKTAIKIIRQMWLCEEKLVGIRVMFNVKGDGAGERIASHSSPIIVSQVNKTPNRNKWMSVGSFLNVDVLKVANTNDHFGNFVVERETKDDKTPSNSVAIQNVDQFESGSSDIVVGLRDVRFSNELTRRLEKPEGRDLLMNVFAMANELERICNRPVMQRLYREYTEEDNARKDQAEKHKTGKAA